MTLKYFCSLLKSLTVPAHLGASWLLPTEQEQLDGHFVFSPLHSPIKIYCDSLPRNLPFLMGLPSFPTSRWLDPSHQISVCLDMKFLRFNHGGSDVCKNHFAQSWTKAGKAEKKDLGVLFSALFLNLYIRKTTLPCKHNSCSPCCGTPGRDCRAHRRTTTAAFCRTYRGIVCSFSVLDSMFIMAKCACWGPACTLPSKKQPSAFWIANLRLSQACM